MRSAPVQTATSSPPVWLTPPVKIGISLLLVAHLAAVFLAPMTAAMGTAIRQEMRRVQAPVDLTTGTPAENPVEEPGEREGDAPLPTPPWPLNVYLDLLYLNHGYGFFAPDPGPSHLVRYTLELPSGETISGQIPDRNQQWPRLRYHRHFMLAEQLGLAPVPMGHSYARHLLKKYGGRRVELVYCRHFPPAPQEVLRGRRLDAPESYLTRPLVVLTAEELTAEESRP